MKPASGEKVTVLRGTIVCSEYPDRATPGDNHAVAATCVAGEIAHERDA